MTVTLRSYQQQLDDAVDAEWEAGARNVLMRLDTGGGKSAIIAHKHARHPGASCLMAHRQELVAQLSLMLARFGVQHSLIASDATKRDISRAHVETFGRCFYSPGSRVVVASVDTLIRAKGIESWAAQVTLWTCDEAHHALRANKWGKAVQSFTHAQCRGLLPTATPGRADGRGLGSHADGFADCMVDGPPMRWLIERGYLTDYDILCPPSDLVVLSDPTASGDWSPTQLRKAAQQSHIVGDVVHHYRTHALGRLGITFCTDVETATETAAAFSASGVPAAVLTGESRDRAGIIKRFERRDILQLVTVDIVSEGFDLPAIEVASLARPTHSLALYMQQFGRALRPMLGKDRALILDHAGNTARHMGPPDKPRVWTLDRRDKRGASAAAAPIGLRVCVGCMRPFERFHTACPYCGEPVPLPTNRSSAAAVEGDLMLLDVETLDRLRGAQVDTSAEGWGAEQWRLTQTGMPGLGVAAGLKRFERTQAAQERLRAAMHAWGGVQHAAGLSDREMQRRFWLEYGLSVLEARALRADEADALTERLTV